MGRTKGLYSEEYPVGSSVQIAPIEELTKFIEEWKWHHPLTAKQLGYAGQTTVVKSVSFYHGGDELYVLENIPGTWHEQCLRSCK